MTPKFVSTLAWVILVSAVISNILNAFPGLNYDPPGWVTPAFLVMSGGAFADKGIRSVVDAVTKGGGNEQGK